MKKGLWVFFFLLLSVSGAWAYEDGRTDAGPFARQGKVIGRGLLNAIGMPFEFSSTLIRETDMHSRLWPATYPFRIATNIFTRAASAVNDIFFFPWAVPFTNDLSPWTEPMGLPDYPWQIE